MKRLVIAAVLLTALLSFCAVMADQDGNYRYCNRDQYGCWITEEDGRRSYIMFWSEEIRKNFIGDKPAVVCPVPEENSATMELAKPQTIKPAVPAKPVQPEPELD